MRGRGEEGEEPYQIGQKGRGGGEEDGEGEMERRMIREMGIGKVGAFYQWRWGEGKV